MKSWNRRSGLNRGGRQSQHNNTRDGSEVFKNTVASTPQTQEYRLDQQNNAPQAPVIADAQQFPRHLFVPEGAQSVWIARAFSVTTGTSLDILTFVAPPGAKTFFLGYAIFDDALLFSTVNFLPTVNGKRVFPYHGDPQNNFKIALGRTVDLGNNAIVPCQLALNPGDVLNWRVTNTAGVDVVMAVGMIGYVDTTNSRTNQRFGG